MPNGMCGACWNELQVDMQLEALWEYSVLGVCVCVCVRVYVAVSVCISKEPPVAEGSIAMVSFLCIFHRHAVIHTRTYIHTYTHTHIRVIDQLKANLVYRLHIYVRTYLANSVKRILRTPIYIHTHTYTKALIVDGM
ncbi:unnamed protein product [Ceratitis capitata]|uniref:(Mediterranean fruit fly) hypothetical protein n=1 Tax=Ceratitis capitata TaxID=7213 RepID=A0A811UXW8_CERCA|nr:unnamed protein product [Ceratitis capitata]